jgi:hypothetical protein
MTFSAYVKVDIGILTRANEHLAAGHARDVRSDATRTPRGVRSVHGSAWSVVAMISGYIGRHHPLGQFQEHSVLEVKAEGE